MSLVWEDELEDVALEIPRSEIAGLRQAELADGQHELVLLIPGGPDLVLEQGPCPLIGGIALQYLGVLELPIAHEADPTCPGRLDEVRDWLDEQSERWSVEHVTQIPNIATLQVTERRGHTTELTSSAQREWVSLTPMLGQCFTLGEVASSRADLRVVMNPDGTARSVRVVGQGSGSGRVDRCLEERMLVASVAPQERPLRLFAHVANP